LSLLKVLGVSCQFYCFFSHWLLSWSWYHCHRHFLIIKFWIAVGRELWMWGLQRNIFI
jgi:hypothetical protein